MENRGQAFSAKAGLSGSEANKTYTNDQTDLSSISARSRRPLRLCGLFHGLVYRSAACASRARLLVRPAVFGWFDACDEDCSPRADGSKSDVPWLEEMLRKSHWQSPYYWGAFVLQPIDEKTTRLIIRSQGDYNPDLKNPILNFFLWRVVFEPAHFIMERKMLLGIKARAEKLARAHAEEKLREIPEYSGW